MSALLPGYEYDIFISYRHNDNLDAWVTDFVEKLEKELRSTLKDSVSIYFDRNSKDGLLETHHVDKSLEGKLKCLIFIPIVSQTYCDTKSFAWEHEFIAFNKFAKGDQFGRDIKLNNGNVASRILPIKIHDLDEEDKALFEKEVEGALRAIEFIFKSAGVNRSLRSNEEHPQDNLNKTFYRDQINKVANVIKDIVRSLKERAGQSLSPATPPIRTRSRPASNKMGIAIGTVVIISLLIAAWYVWRQPPMNKLIELSIAVLPFQNLSSDKDQESFNAGLTVDITDRLTKIKNLRVISRTSVLQYKDHPPPIPQIGKELNVGYVLEGSVSRQGSRVKIVTQLIQAKTGDHLWSETIESDASDVFKIQAEIATKIARYLKLSLSVNEQGELNNIPTRSMEAYDLYTQGFALENTSVVANNYKISSFRKAAMLDPEFGEAYADLAQCYLKKALNYGDGLFWYDSAFIYASKAIQLRPSYANGYLVMGSIYRAKNQWDQAKPYYLKCESLQPGLGLEVLTTVMLNKHKLDSAMFYGVKATRYHPRHSWAFFQLGETFLEFGMYDSAIRCYEKASDLTPEFPGNGRARKAGVLIRMKQYDQAIDYLNSNIPVDTTKSRLRQTRLGLAISYAFKEDWNKVIFYLEQRSSPNELMALALLKNGDETRAQTIIKNKKEEFTKSHSKHGLAWIAILEGDLPAAAKLLDAAYSNYELYSRDLEIDPLCKELSNTKEYQDLLAKIDAIRKAAWASIKRMQ